MNLAFYSYDNVAESSQTNKILEQGTFYPNVTWPHGIFSLASFPAWYV